jgi:DNA transposition AAA+ family ATPase
MRDIFLETANVSRYRRAVAAMDPETGLPGIGLAWGQAGRGKTLAAKRDHADHGRVYLHVRENWTQTAFLQSLAFEVCGERPATANRCKDSIVARLDTMPRMIVVDEADRLRVGRIEDLRDIHNEVGVAVMLIGEEELLGLLGERRRVWSRVVQEVEFRPATEEDVATYHADAADLDVTPEACALIQRRTEGDMRLIRNMALHLEEAARARQVARVTVEMVNQVLSLRSWRRK